MYSKEEAKQLKADFWNQFKVHMQKVRSSNGRRMNWLAYPTEVKDIYVRVDVDGKGARFTFDIQGKDEGVRAILWEQLTELKIVLEEEMGTEGVWIENASTSVVSDFNRIIWERRDLNFYRKEDHPEIINFLSERLIHFDAFYQEFKDILINLAS
ncbi:DUF4268 domain-containing protein [Fluviicola taffensis]|uniref:DUF4268 domain-containing protein n=1 Tax=Fluviicola taffensis (strain DSM 16823 / NCIMB 13979 / RW262) TaxID=755732 RepID=F2ICG7_FLUTR|nr:DUF4268 domain-containing protein [Fluviicola taffensis]AEA45437.1 hypothetical protein Fluta_3465 [Fluviicola taffensis DSM 16823]